MQWCNHRRWAQKFGISNDVADYVNKIIDIADAESLPEEYKRDTSIKGADIADSRGAKRGNSALGLVIAEDAKGHDAGRRKQTRGDLAAECTLSHLYNKGDDFVDAWYLHHHLDYLQEQSAANGDLRETIRQYRNEYPEAYSQEVEEFLLNHVESLASELDYHET